MPIFDGPAMVESGLSKLSGFHFLDAFLYFLEAWEGCEARELCEADDEDDIFVDRCLKKLEKKKLRGS